MKKIPIRITVKAWFYSYYWLLVSVASAGLIAWYIFRGPIESGITAAIITGLLSITFFLQKQKLEELKLFNDLFIKFNARFDNLNDELNKIVLKNDHIEQNEKQTLYDYFNLSGEEYFYFNRGYIPIEVWKSWVNGMSFFNNSDAIKKIWDEELDQNSYYGFSKELLK